MKNKGIFRALSICVAFIFLFTTSGYAASMNIWNSFPKNTANVWSKIKDKVAVLPGRTGYLFFPATNEQLAFLEEIIDDIKQELPNSRIIYQGGVAPISYYTTLSDDILEPGIIEFVDETGFVIAQYNRSNPGFWEYFGDKDDEGRRLYLDSEGNERIASENELVTYGEETDQYQAILTYFYDTETKNDENLIVASGGGLGVGGEHLWEKFGRKLTRNAIKAKATKAIVVVIGVSLVIYLIWRFNQKKAEEKINKTNELNQLLQNN